MKPELNDDPAQKAPRQRPCAARGKFGTAPETKEKRANMKKYCLFVAVAMLNAQLAVSTTQAQDTNTVELIKQLQKRIDDLENKVKVLEAGKPAEAQATDAQAKQRIADLDQKVKILERSRELDLEASEAKAKEAPQITIGRDGFSLASADKNYALQLKGVLQVDSRTFFQDSGIIGIDSLLLRRRSEEHTSEL